MNIKTKKKSLIEQVKDIYKYSDKLKVRVESMVRT